MTFHRLPEDIRLDPRVQDAWHHRHEERIGEMEHRLSNSGGQVPLGYVRPVGLVLLIATGTGIIKPELALKIFLALIGINI